MIFTYILSLLLVLGPISCYRILVVFPVPSKSHEILGYGIVKSLLEAGHEVTFVTPFPEKNAPKSLQQIDLADLRPLAEHLNMMQFKRRNDRSFQFVRDFAHNITRLMMEDTGVKNALLDKKGYDALITEWFFTDAQAGMAALLQCPWILVSTTVIHPHLEYLIDEVQSPALHPPMMLNFPTPMNLWQRIASTAVVVMFILSSIFQELPYAANDYNRLYSPIAQAKGIQLPDFYDAVHNISAIFINSHSSVANPHSLGPNMVEIGGYHINPNIPPLPEDLQKLLDDSKQGVVYFSMGSVMKSSQMPKEKQKLLMDVFRELPYTVLWKFETEIENLPKNVHIRPWIPQMSVLAHPNVKVFITHAGGLSTLESVYSGVPIITIPMFGDQPMNADRAVSKGYAIRIEFTDNLANDLRAALKEMLSNSKYYETAQKLSKLFRDRPIPTRKLVSYWTEYVIRTGGAKHLKSLAQSVPFYQRYLLDQIFILVCVIWGIVYFVKRICKKTKKKEKTQ